MVLQCGLKLSTACAGSGTSQDIQAKVSCYLCSALGLPSMSYKAICRWLLLLLGLEVPTRGQATNQDQLLLGLGLGPLIERYGAHQGQMLLV